MAKRTPLRNQPFIIDKVSWGLANTEREATTNAGVTLAGAMTAIDDAARPWVTALRWLETSIEAVRAFREADDEAWPLVAGEDYPTLQAIRTMSLRMAKAHFLLVAAHQATKFLAKLPPRFGDASRPEQLGQLEEIIDMRNLFEHWDEHAATFEAPYVSPSRAAKRFAARHSAVHPGAGNARLIGSLDLIVLGADLDKARFATVECLRAALSHEGVALRD